MLINENNQGTATAVAGTFSVNLVFNQVEVKRLVVTSATSTTTFDVKLVSTSGINVVEAEDQTGHYNENVTVPTMRNMTLTIENASVDELFTYYVSGIERYA